MLDKLASLMVRTGLRLYGWLKTREAHAVSRVGKGTRIGSSGRVVNVAADKPRISIGENGVINGEIVIFAHDGKIEIGDWFYIGPGSTVWSSSTNGVKIGNRVLISMGVNIHDTNSHPLDPVQRFEQMKAMISQGHPTHGENIKAESIEIGDDVWIGLGATVLKGVKIGDRAIISSNAIVKNDVPADGFVAPATVH